MIIIHHLEQSRSQRIVWLLEALGVPYQIKTYSRDPNTKLAPPELKRVHPLGKAPVIEDEGTVIAESGAIIEYILEKYGDGRLQPQTPEQKGHYRYWMHYAEGSLMPILVMSLIFSKIPEAPMPFFVRPLAKKLMKGVTDQFIAPQLRDHLAMIEHHLTTHDWLCGDILTAADIQMSFPLIAMRPRLDPQQHGHIVAYLERIEQQPGYQSALCVVGPLKTL
ncbi:glutathione S-transferase [Salinivibrio proteolyticus]|uniref:glutathione S-transferase family protein n=1 Tax=Salinivibrio proteolyticus TaxID=334715 RepID=UPI00098933B0|nr:glutathione S-transferase [Salinivibrio proteolyticus]OOF27536.1 glutathione S-transferase [Salinivibrio proteolyticus]